VAGRENLPDGIKVPVIKDEQELVCVLESLHRVRRALREVPHVAHLELGDLKLPVLVDGRDDDRACVQVAPFGLFYVKKCTSQHKYNHERAKRRKRQFAERTTRCQ
jgi:hypothetical protein